MFEYTHEVLSTNDNFSWGIFPNESIAEVMHLQLSRMFNEDGITFIVRQIK